MYSLLSFRALLSSLLVLVASLLIYRTDKMAFLLQAATVFLAGAVSAQSIPEQAQVIDQLSFNVLNNVPPPAEMNLTSVSPLSMRPSAALIPFVSLLCRQA